jgi:hypothetical protein
MRSSCSMKEDRCAIPFHMSTNIVDNREVSFCDHRPFPTSMLLVCSRINTEAMEILYGENTLCLNVWDKKTTKRFTRLRPCVLSAIRNLHVFYSPNCRSFQLLGVNAPQDYQRNWLRVCSVLKPIDTSSLTLTFESFPQDLPTACQILSPISDMNLRHL